MSGDGYVIKGIFSGLTPAEKLYLISHPTHIVAIKEAADFALAEAVRRFRGPGLHNGEGDAFRHCLWSALMARDIGPENALIFSTAHEAYSANPPGEREMDLHNNSVGIGIGMTNRNASNAELAALCQSALDRGQLMLRPGVPGEPYPY